MFSKIRCKHHWIFSSLDFSKNFCCFLLSKINNLKKHNCNLHRWKRFSTFTAPLFFIWRILLFYPFGKDVQSQHIYEQKIFIPIIAKLQKLNFFINPEEGVWICSILNQFFNTEGNIVSKIDHKNHHERLI